ncbi:type I restriction-modification enzyme R subunit C-terminal domain-containing protein [Geotalea uraniireducens]
MLHGTRTISTAEFADKGGLQKAWGLFGAELDSVMEEMNEELVA